MPAGRLVPRGVVSRGAGRLPVEPPKAGEMPATVRKPVGEPGDGWLRRAVRVLRARDGAAGSAATGLVAILAATSIAAGLGVPAVAPRLANVGAWLNSTGRGLVVHVNGLSGRPDGTVQLSGPAGHRLRVVQRGRSAYVVDENTGQVSRIDPAQLDIAETRGFRAAGVQLVPAGAITYVVDAARGLVQRIDPNSLFTIGAPVSLPAPLGSAEADGGGTLWVLVPATGRVVPIHDGRAGVPVSVGRPNDPLTLTIAAGTPVVTDVATAISTVVGPTGARLRVNLPSDVAAAGAQDLLAPAAASGGTVPLLSTPSDALVLLDTRSGSLSTVTLDVSDHRLGAPQVLGQRVYVPDQTTGSLIVYDTAAGQFDAPVTVTGRPGPLEAFVQDGLLWVNDESGPDAVVVQPDGSSRSIGKYDTQVPGPRPSSQPLPAIGPLPPVGGGTTRVAPAVPPVPAATPAPAPAVSPHAPGAVTATSGPGWIQVTFAPSPGGGATGYALQGVPTGAALQPAQVGPAGPFVFQVTGGSCAAQYTFTVVAIYAGGQVPSAPTLPIRPCVAPGAPQNLQATPGNHRVDLSWTPPVNTGGSQVTYDLTWSGVAAGSSPGIGGLTASVTGLTNGGAYTFDLLAANGAGSGLAAARVTATLVGPPQQYHVYNDPVAPLAVRANPDVGAPVVGTIPPGVYPLVTVLCQVSGGHAQDGGDPNLQGSIWDRIAGYGPSAYVSDLYVRTPESVAGQYSKFSYPPLWQCT